MVVAGVPKILVDPMALVVAGLPKMFVEPMELVVAGLPKMLVDPMEVVVAGLPKTFVDPIELVVAGLPKILADPVFEGAPANILVLLEPKAGFTSTLPNGFSLGACPNPVLVPPKILPDGVVLPTLSPPNPKVPVEALDVGKLFEVVVVEPNPKTFVVDWPNTEVVVA